MEPKRPTPTYYQRNREKALAKCRAYRTENHEKVLAGKRVYRQHSREKIVEYRKTTRGKDAAGKRRRLYGITEAEYGRMLERQGEKCAICGLRKRLCIDHDHETGKIRGLLCHRCNSRLGRLERDWIPTLRYLGVAT